MMSFELPTYRIANTQYPEALKGPRPMKSLKCLLLTAVSILTFGTPAALAANGITFGTPLSGTISSPAQSNIYSFTANANDVVIFTATITNGSLDPQIQLYGTTGTLLSTANDNYDGGCHGSPSMEMNPVQLPASGTYTVVLSDCSNTNTGSYEFYAQRTNNPTGATALSFGQTDAGAVTLPAQNSSYTFSANANDAVDLTVTTTMGSLDPKIRIYNPNGTLLNTADDNYDGGCHNSSSVEMNPITLPATGTYTVLIADCADTSSGSYEIYSQRTDDPGGPVSLSFGHTSSGSVNLAAQSSTYTFNATANDYVTFTMVTTSGSLDPQIQLYSPTGALINTANDNYDGGCHGSTAMEMSAFQLPATGLYTVLVNDCSSTNTGSFELYPQRTNNPGAAAPILFSQTLSGMIGSSAQSNTYTFSALANDVVDFTMVTTSGSLDPKIRIYNPNGTLLNIADDNYDGGCHGSTTVEMNTVTLATAGTYTVLVGDCPDTNTGNYEIYTQRTNNPTGATPVLWGQVQAGTITSQAQSGSYSFVGSAGGTVNFTATTTSGSLDPKITLYNPDGSQLSIADDNYDGGCHGGTTTNMSSISLTQTGAYTVLLGDCSDTNTGNYNLSSLCFGTCPLPAPVLTSLSSTSVLAGSPGFTLTVNGSNFVNVAANSVVEWNGVPLATTWVSSTKMTAIVPAADIATAGYFAVTVTTPAPGGGTSASIQFTVNNPVPATTSPLSPAIVLAGGGSFTLTVSGSNFVNGSSVLWNGNPLTTVFVSGSKLQATVHSPSIANTGTAAITVFNAAPGGGTSNAQTIQINNPVPKITSLGPSAVTYGGAAFPLKVTGTGFVNGSVIWWNSTSLVTTYISSTEVQATIPAADIAAPGTASVTVINTTPGGGTSNPLTFNIEKITPTITWAAPAPITYGTALSGTQLDATFAVSGTPLSGTPVYSPTAGTVLKAGTQQLTVTFTPSDGTHYAVATGSVNLTVKQVVPVVSWPAPAPITYGTALSGTQLDASVTVNGTALPATPVYNPASGAIPAAGNQTLSVTFTPQDATDYATVTGSTSLTVNQATQTISFTPPASPQYVGASAIPLTATGGASGSPVTFSMVSGPGTLSGTNNSVLKITGAGTIVIAANQAGNSNYKSAPQVTGSITVLTPIPSQLASPAPGSTLAGSSATFAWGAESGASGYWLFIGSTGVGSKNLYDSGETTATTINVANLPTNGAPIYVRVYTGYNGVLVSNDYTFTEAARAVLTTPAPGSSLASSSATFNWTAATGSGNQGYWLFLGSTGAGSKNLFDSGQQTATSATVNNLPTNGETIYARIYTSYNGTLVYNDYTYTAWKEPASLTSPVSGSTLAGPVQTFTWTQQTGSQGYWLFLGTTGVGSKNLYDSGETTATSATVSNLPLSGATIYARIYTSYNGTLVSQDYTYTAAEQAMMTAPVPGSAVTGPSATFTWSAATGTGVQGYWLFLGTTGAGSKNLYDSGETTATSETVNVLPATGTIYARVYTSYNGTLEYLDYTYTAQ